MRELQTHQVELEQQNGELLRTQHDLATARDRFVDLFDSAPVSYLTLGRDGRIAEANATAAAEFETDRQALLGSRFIRHVAVCDGDRWQRAAAAAFHRDALRQIEVTLLRQDGRHFQVQLHCRRVVRAGSQAQLHIAFTDVSQRQLAEKNRRIATSSSIARESERRALARRLHEDLAQRLGALKMNLGTMVRTADAVSLSASVRSMTAQVDQALALVRRMSTDLHPLMLDNLGLNAALDWLAGDAASRLDLAIEAHLQDEEPEDESLALAVYRLTEVAIEHLARYVDAGVSIELLKRPDDWVLLLQVLPGHGRPDAPIDHLLDMPEPFRDRVHLLGGRLETSVMPGDVHRICVFLQAASSGVQLSLPADFSA